MTQPTKQFIFWAPRVLCILFAVLVSLFALDVFNHEYEMGRTIPAFAIHLIPTFIILLVLALSWRWEWIGGILFIALGIYFIVSSWEKFQISAYLLISGPLFLIGILFLINWFKHSELRVSH
jgi:hypothetical protein